MYQIINFSRFTVYLRIFSWNHTFKNFPCFLQIHLCINALQIVMAYILAQKSGQLPGKKTIYIPNSPPPETPNM